MPEGPEVAVMTNCLRAHIEGSTLTSLRVIKESFEKKTKGFSSLELPQKVVSVCNKGKLSYLKLENNMYVAITYGMTGGIRLSRENDKHASVDFTYNDDQHIYYRSVRNFGTVHVLNEAELEYKLKSLGAYILDTYAFQPAEIVPRFRKHDRKNITVVLMDQSVLCGVGNYIKSEILYAVGVNPNSSVSDLSDETIFRLYEAARELAQKAVEHGGASLYTYTDEMGEETGFKSLLNVYNKKQDSAGNQVVRIKTPDKRSTFWVPIKQDGL